MRLRPATAGDRDLLEHWDRQPHVQAALGSDGPFDWAAELDRNLAGVEMLIAEDDGRPVGFVQVIDPAIEPFRYWGEVGPGLRAVDIWLGDAADLGRGLGTRIMRAVLARCFADPTVQAVLVDPLAQNERAHRFYARVGFRPAERRRFGDDDCLVMRVDRDGWRQSSAANAGA